MELNLDWRRETSALWPEVSYELRPLRVWAFHELLAYWQSSGVSAPDRPSDSTGRPNAAQGLGLMTVARRILPEHVRALEGVILVQGGERAPASLESLCEEAALMPLAGEIISRLVARSELPPAAEKN
jgi:hypothetical protein